jgi:hypothetical protein
MGKLSCQNKKVSSLTTDEVKQMFKLFTKYYTGVDRTQFVKDLDKKDYVFVLRDKESYLIKGFSTIVSLNLKMNNKNIQGYFSGDTVVDKEYWGQKVLGIHFLLFLFTQKIKKPMTPLYWFLISKGYKTYLLMANNFKEHYPRYENDTPNEKKNIITEFSRQLYGDKYNESTGVISYSSQKTLTKDCLKGDVTPITDEMMLSNQRIEYFAKTNPNWSEGDELACLAKMTLYMPIYYWFKKISKSKSRKVKIKDLRTSEV